KVSNSDIKALLGIFKKEMALRGVGSQSIKLMLIDGSECSISELASSDEIVGIHYKSNMFLNPVESIVKLDMNTGIFRLEKPEVDSFKSGEFEGNDMFLMLRHGAVMQTENIRRKLLRMYRFTSKN
ncbi:hypothetical protein LMH73_004690, partial [Vibrio splendidus]